MSWTFFRNHNGKVNASMPWNAKFGICFFSQVAKHKSAQRFGHALIPLTKEEYTWFKRFVHHRHKYPVGKSSLVFANSNGGIFQRLLNSFQDRWTEFKLPGSPTFGLIRSSIGTFVRYFSHYEIVYLTHQQNSLICSFIFFYTLC